MAYQLTNGSTILRLADNAHIPADTGNKDYRDYLVWLNEGNEPVPAQAQPDYQAFWEALLTSSVYASIREQSMTSLAMNTLGTEFVALLGDAKAGRPHEAAIQASMDAILALGNFTAEQQEELRNALAAGSLENVYTLS